MLLKTVTTDTPHWIYFVNNPNPSIYIRNPSLFIDKSRRGCFEELLQLSSLSAIFVTPPENTIGERTDHKFGAVLPQTMPLSKLSWHQKILSFGVFSLLWTYGWSTCFMSFAITRRSGLPNNERNAQSWMLAWAVWCSWVVQLQVNTADIKGAAQLLAVHIRRE